MNEPKRGGRTREQWTGWADTYHPKHSGSNEALHELIGDAFAFEWQPMETAPKEGPVEDILLFVPGESGTGRVVVGHWAHGGGEEQPRFGPAWFQWTGYMFDELRRPPAAWMRLPKVPR